MSEHHNTKSHKEADHHRTDGTSIDASHVKHSDDDDHNHDQIDTESKAIPGWQSHWQLLLSLSILIVMLILEFGLKYTPPFPLDLTIYLAAYLLGGYNVLFMAFRKAKRFDFFNEFFLMSVATIGAFAIGSYSE